MKETAIEAAKISPPASVGSLSLLGVGLDQWVVVLTLIYTLILIVDKLFPAALPAVRKFIKGLFK